MPFIIDEQNAKLESGAWFNYQDSEFLIASNTSLKFLRAMDRLQRPFRRLIEKGRMDPGEQLKILNSAMAEAILLDWKNVKDKDGADVPYSREIAFKALKSDPTFREFVMETSTDVGNYKEDEALEEVKS